MCWHNSHTSSYRDKTKNIRGNTSTINLNKQKKDIKNKLHQVTDSRNNTNITVRIRVVKERKCGSGQRSRSSNSLRTGRSGARIPMEARFCRTPPFWSWAPPPPQLPLQWVRGIFPGDIAAEAWSWQPTPSSTEVKVRVKLHPYTPSGPSLQVIGCTFTFKRDNVFLNVLVVQFHSIKSIAIES